MNKLFAIGLLLFLAAGCERRTKVIVYDDPPADTCKGRDDRALRPMPIVERADFIPCRGDPNFDGQSAFVGDADPFLGFLSTGTFHKQPANIDTLQMMVENLDINCDRYNTDADFYAWLHFLDSTGYGIEPYPGCIPCQGFLPAMPVIQNKALAAKVKSLAGKGLIWTD